MRYRDKSVSGQQGRNHVFLGEDVFHEINSQVKKTNRSKLKLVLSSMMGVLLLVGMCWYVGFNRLWIAMGQASLPWLILSALTLVPVYLPRVANQYGSVCGERTQSDARMQVYVWLRENTEESSIIIYDLSSGVINYYSNRVAYDVNLVGKPVPYEEISQIIKNNENVYLIDEICIQSKAIYEKIRENFNFTSIQQVMYRYKCVFRREYTFKIYKIS